MQISSNRGPHYTQLLHLDTMLIMLNGNMEKQKEHWSSFPSGLNFTSASHLLAIQHINH